MSLDLPWRAGQLNERIAWRRKHARRWRNLAAWNAAWIVLACMVDGTALAARGVDPWLRYAFVGTITSSLIVGVGLLAQAVGCRRNLLEEVAEIERFAALPTQARGALAYTRSLAQGGRYPVVLTGVWLRRQ